LRRKEKEMMFRRDKNLIATLEEIIKQLREDALMQTEVHQRELREVEHNLGLERKRHQMEIEEAVRNVQFSAGQELLREKTSNFDNIMKTVEKHHTEILSRLPTVHVDKQVKQGR